MVEGGQGVRRQAGVITHRFTPNAGLSAAEDK